MQEELIPAERPPDRGTLLSTEKPHRLYSAAFALPGGPKGAVPEDGVDPHSAVFPR